MTRVPIITVDDIHDGPFWFPKLRDEGYRDFEVTITTDSKWLISGIKYDHLVVKQPKKTKKA